MPQVLEVHGLVGLFQLCLVLEPLLRVVAEVGAHGRAAVLVERQLQVSLELPAVEPLRESFIRVRVQRGRHVVGVVPCLGSLTV